MSKYLVLVGDGMAGWPLAGYDEQTTLELAKTPNFDFLVSHGKMGLVQNVPPTLPPGSDVASLSIFGYDPELYYNGRASLEAVSLGIPLAQDEMVFRANLVKVVEGKMVDFTAGHISTESARPLIDLLNAKVSARFGEVQFYCGVSYRHIMKMKTPALKVSTVPPHDITGQQIASWLPGGEGADRLAAIMALSEEVLAGQQATQVWLWGPGGRMNLPSFESKYGLRGGVISAVDLMKGIAMSCGLDYISVPGITGFIDTNFVGKATYALQALEKDDIVFLHVEAPDEAGHMGDVALKISAIEKIDEEVLGTLLGANRDISVLLLPDHPTPIQLRTHSREPVPFVIYHPSEPQRHSFTRLTEKQAAGTGWMVSQGHHLLETFLR